MNGDELTKLAKYSDKDWRGFLIAKVEDIQVNQLEHTKRLNETKTCVSKLAVVVAKLPTHCIQEKKIEDIDKKVDILNEDKAGRKAVSKAIWGGSGLIGFVSVLFMVLKIFGVL